MKNQKIRDKISGVNNSQWRGDDVKYNPLHQWIKNHKPKPDVCDECKIKTPYDLANISGKYKRDINDFEWLCRSCHMKKDNRILNLYQGKKKGWEIRSNKL